MSKDDFFQRLFSSIGDSFQHNQFCDVQLHGRRSKLDFTLKSVSCHSLVLCSVAPAFTSVLKEVPADPGTGMKCVYFPDVNFSEILNFVQQIYKGISSDDFELLLSQDLATVLGIVETQGSSIADSDEEMSGENVQEVRDENYTMSNQRNVNSGNNGRRRGPSYPYSCPHKNCGKVFSNLHRKNVHIAKTHINVDGKDCQMCGKKVTNSFDEHQRMFHKSKDCSDCNITFIGMKSLLEHQRKIHSDIHTCQICNLKFSGKLKWLTHMRRSHDKRSDDSTLTPFFCDADACQKAFAAKNQLLEHIKLEHSNKPFTVKMTESKTIEL